MTERGPSSLLNVMNSSVFGERQLLARIARLYINCFFGGGGLNTQPHEVGHTHSKWIYVATTRHGGVHNMAASVC